MDGLAITNIGVESVAAKEIEELISAKAGGVKAGKSVVRFPIKDMLDLCLLCYRAQSVAKVLLLAAEGTVKDEDDVAALAKRADFSLFLTEGKTFRVRCVRNGEHPFDSLDAEQAAGEALAARYGCKANLADPDIPVYIYIQDERCHLGVDFSGTDLSKRHYRIFSPTETLKATTAYAMLRVAGFTDGKSLLDPFCGGGSVLIEAALLSTRRPVNFYSKDQFAFRRFPCLAEAGIDALLEKADKGVREGKSAIVGYDVLLGRVKAAQKNAKVAGVHKAIDASKIDVEWLDTKFGKGELDMIVTCPPILTAMNEKSMRKAYKELFYQAEFVLKKAGKIVLATPVPDAFAAPAKEYGFTESGRLAVDQGKQRLYILTFSHPKA